MLPAFLFFVFIVSALLWAAFGAWLRPAWVPKARIGLVLWLLYAGLIGASGLVRSTAAMPPGPMLLFGPLLVFAVAFLGRSRAGATIAISIPLSVLTAAQSFRVVVELFLHTLWVAGLAPRMLTWEGANFDMLVGLSAPVFAWMISRQMIGTRTLLLWNFAGLAMLGNVIVRALLTAPGPLNLIQASPPNLVISTFPYTYIPGLLAPLALMLHILSIRAIRSAR